ncbi:MAG: hypothetical protein IPI38_17055 [Gemmatimonadetes bacterium]|nr:hypothetical protein [Gemmatimonadota bacterium]MBK7349896.1 hypothetical protein [Gemmatimonadota bacterium]MBK7717099.1 hypothetical protein [Gemmatimonadota bacterium]MBK7784526.1 hypothetical protein [Gemmatimonadota bacterium]MBK7925472.1 hypothetical protein [Gemmatimonadota bacterium]
MAAPTATADRPSPILPVLAGGFLAGTIDILYAWIFWSFKAGVGLLRIFQSVSAGLLGKAGLEGGLPTAFLGAALHYTIACAMAVTYYLVARRAPVLVRNAVPCGLAYGALCYAIMHYVVVPLSRAGAGSRDPLWVGLSIVVHVVGIGLPIALATRRALRAA